MIPLKPKPLYLQVEEFVREKIDSGEYAVNSKIPSTSALATITGTSFCTVQTALSKLCREGLLDRSVGRSTYVKGETASLSCVGLYFNRPFYLASSDFYKVLEQELRRKLGEQGVKVRVWTDEREESEQTEPIATLKQAMDGRQIQALIAPMTNHEDVCWLCKCPVPVAALTPDDSIPSRVGEDVSDFVRFGLTELQNQGCRTVGVITPLVVRPDAPTSLEMVFYRSLVEIAGELGVEIRNEWIRSPEQYTPQHALNTHYVRFGYEQFHALWNLPQRPEGVLVYPDVVATGVVTAILERRLNVPQDLKIVFHANDMLPYVCPFPATFLISAVGRVADALIEMVRAQLAGGEPHPIHVPISVVRDGNPFSLQPTPTNAPANHLPTEIRQEISASQPQSIMQA